MSKKKFMGQMEAPANTTFRIKTYDPDHPNRKPLVPRSIEKSEDWIEIKDPEVYLEIWPAFAHKVANMMDEYRCFVHKLDPYFTLSPMFLDLKEEVITHYGDKLSRATHKAKVHEEDLSIWELISFIYKNLGEKVLIDLDTSEVEYQEVDKIVTIEYNEWNKSELYNKCKELGLPVKGTKAELIARLDAFDKPSSGEDTK